MELKTTSTPDATPEAKQTPPARKYCMPSDGNMYKSKSEKRLIMNVYKKIKSIPLFLIVVLGACVWVFVTFLFKIDNGIKRTNSLENDLKRTVKAWVIPEKHFTRKRKSDFVYKYMFRVNDIEYKGICPDESFKIGDTIVVDYVMKNPNFNTIHEN